MKKFIVVLCMVLLCVTAAFTQSAANNDDDLFAMIDSLALKTNELLAVSGGINHGEFGCSGGGGSGGGLIGAGAGAKIVQEIEPNKIVHLFNNIIHRFEPLLEYFGGNRTEAANAIVNAGQQLVNDYGLTGKVIEKVVSVAGMNVTISGKVINGVFRIGTAFIPN